VSADPVSKLVAAKSADGVSGPLYFPHDRPRLFGWLHAPLASAISRTGVVICKPFGYEALCSHRSTRVFAERIAELGIPALRFDYTGTMDSAELDPQSDQIAAWVADIIDAARELRRRTGVQRVCLLGFRLGALLATLAARQSDCAEELILIAPVVNGRRYVREMRTTALAAQLLPDGTPTPSEDGSVADGSMEVSGHPLSAATLASLVTVDLPSLTGLRAARMLIIDRQELSTARPMYEAVARSGIEAHYAMLPGFVEMMLTATQFAAVPREMIGATLDWLRRYESPGAAGPRMPAAPPRDPQCDSRVVLALPQDGGGQESMLSERPVFFGAGLFGIVSEPRPGEHRRRAVVLLNASADQHAGVSRMHVSFARRWARHGYHVLRLDLQGIGDSLTRPGRRDDEVFPPGALEDVAAALEFIAARYGIRDDLNLCGLCSGAYHALRAGVAGLPVQRLLMVNPESFFWSEEMAVGNQVQLVDVLRNAALYRSRMLSREAWNRLLAGRVSIRRILQIYLRRPLLTLESMMRELARSLHIRIPRDLGSELEALGERGVRLAFVFAKGEPGIELLRMQAGSALRRLGERCHIHIIDGGDHSFSRGGPRTNLEDLLSAELLAPPRAEELAAPLQRTKPIQP
jgi:alpha-beta hydrolase superfamily lysophospholipase